MRYGIFFRAINVGKHNRVRMEDLRSLAEELGFGEVRTYLQSGNMALVSDATAESVASRVEAALPGLGLKDVAVMVRSRDELLELGSRADGFVRHSAGEHRQLAIFTRDPVEAAEPVPYAVKGLTFVAVEGAAVLAAIHRDAAGRVNANAVVESLWRTRATTRWWNVVEEFCGECLR
ncbi:MAG TPA: DUF1697 domain-containing protein [Gaiellaceae bacterium]|nr:DUF1697 domain-containing protein [Gaiellaceae bacterium]